MPRKENKLLVVCSRCKNQIKAGVENEKELNLPKNFLKLVESNQAKSGTAKANQESSSPSDAYSQELAKRLEILKKRDKSKRNLIDLVVYILC